MARKFLTALDLAKNELQNAAVQSLASAPSSPVKFQLYGNTSDNTLYWWNGTAWVAASPGTGFPGYGAVPAETTFGIAKNDGVALTVSRSDHTHGSPTHDNAAHSTIPLSALAAPTANVSMGNFLITNLGSPSNSTDAATKNYVDSAVQGLAWKEPCRVATTANITLSGLQTIDGVTVVSQDRVLVKDQSTGSQNGIYVALSGAWNRAGDADSMGDLDAAAVWINQGTANGDKAFVCTTDPPITPGTTATTWVQFGGGQAITAGAGLTGTTTFDVGAGTGITVAADSVALDTTYADGRYALVANGAKRYAVNVGGSTSVVVNHALSTRDVVVDVYRVASPYDSVECDVERTDTANVTLRFAIAPAAGEYRCVVLA